MDELPAYYDRSCCPVSYDVVSFLMMVERKRIERRLDKVVIEILPGPWEGFRRDHNWPYTIHERRHLLEYVVIPMCYMLRSCGGVVVHNQRINPAPGAIGYSEYSMAFKEYTDSYALGIRPLQSGIAASKDSKTSHQTLITITLRESEHWPERNSNLEEWGKAHAKLRKKGYKVVVVRDTGSVAQGARPLPPLSWVDPIMVNPDAWINLHERAKLYCSADLNLFVNNGPAWFAMALDAPAILFKPTAETSCWAHTAAAMKQCGIIEGQQMKGAPPHQRLSWLPETADNIVKEVYDFFHPAIVPANWPVFSDEH